MAESPPPGFLGNPGFLGGRQAAVRTVPATAVADDFGDAARAIPIEPRLHRGGEHSDERSDRIAGPTRLA